MKLVFASNNINKLNEIRKLAPDGYEILSLNDIHCNEELSETGTTLKENAFQKASFVFQKYHVNCFADDTGLEVSSLNGEPGVYSARYAGENNNADENISKLLKQLEGIENRKAQFKTIIAAIINGEKYFFEGIVKGDILKIKKGKNGFGYDPVFIPEGSKFSFAEMTMDEKNKNSHRAKALNLFIQFLNHEKRK
jgi:XTP/dITP diphosphohydrolase